MGRWLQRRFWSLRTCRRCQISWVITFLKIDHMWKEKDKGKENCYIKVEIIMMGSLKIIIS